MSFVVALLAAPLGISMRRNGERRFAISRSVALRLLSAGILVVYLLSVLLLVTMTGDLAAPFGRVVQLGLLFGLAVAALALMPSAALRSWLKVEISKHFSRIAMIIARSGLASPPLLDEAARRRDRWMRAWRAPAIAEVMQAPGAILYLRDPDGARWSMPMTGSGRPTPDRRKSLPAAIAERLEPRRREEGSSTSPPIGRVMATCFRAGWRRDSRAWVLAPLIHEKKLVGAIHCCRARMSGAVSTGRISTCCASSAARLRG